MSYTPFPTYAVEVRDLGEWKRIPPTWDVADRDAAFDVILTILDRYPQARLVREHRGTRTFELYQRQGAR